MDFRQKYIGSQNNNFNRLKLHKLESKTLNATDLPKEGIVAFKMNFNIKGSKQIQFIPIGKETTANISSDWKTASFFGEFPAL